MVAILQGQDTFTSVPNVLYENIRTRAAERFNKEKAELQTQADERAALISATDDRLINVKAQINNVELAVDNAKDAVEDVSSKLINLRGTLARFSQDGEDKDLLREQFDQQFASLNREVDKYSPAFNAAGNVNRNTFDPNTFEYRRDLSGNVRTVTGTYIGSEYRITQDDGSVWVVDPSTSIIEHKTAFDGKPLKYTMEDGTKIDETTTANTGLELLSYDEKTGAISFKAKIVGEEEPVTVNGRLEREGIELMPSWFYNNLETDADVKRAFADVERADALLTLGEAVINRADTTVQMDQRKVDEQLSANSKKRGEALIEGFKKEADLQIEISQQLYALQNNLSTIENQRLNYLSLFAGQLNNSFYNIQI